MLLPGLPPRWRLALAGGVSLAVYAQYLALLSLFDHQRPADFALPIAYFLNDHGRFSAALVWWLVGTSVVLVWALAVAVQAALEKADRVAWAIGGGVAAAAFLVLLFVYPPFSRDLFLYVVQARDLALHGASPYRVPLDRFGDPLVAFVTPNQRHGWSFYGPLWYALAWPVGRWSADGLLAPAIALKAIDGVFVPLTGLAAAWAVRAVRPRWALAAFVAAAWNPLALLEFVASGHNDALMLFLVALAVGFALRGRWSWTFVMLSASVLAKYVSVVLAPVVLLWAWRETPGALPAPLPSTWAEASLVIRTAGHRLWTALRRPVGAARAMLDWPGLRPALAAMGWLGLSAVLLGALFFRPTSGGALPSAAVGAVNVFQSSPRAVLTALLEINLPSAEAARTIRVLGLVAFAAGYVWALWRLRQERFAWLAAVPAVMFCLLATGLRQGAWRLILGAGVARTLTSHEASVERDGQSEKREGRSARRGRPLHSKGDAFRAFPAADGRAMLAGRAGGGGGRARPGWLLRRRADGRGGRDARAGRLHAAQRHLAARDGHRQGPAARPGAARRDAGVPRLLA